MNYEVDWLQNKLLDKLDAIKFPHRVMCQTLNYFLRSNKWRNQILQGERTDAIEQDECYFSHGSLGILTEDSKVIVGTTCFDDVVLSPAEFFYYLRIAYKRFMSRDNPQVEKDEFTAGMQHFRDSCKIKCDENGDPILEELPLG